MTDEDWAALDRVKATIPDELAKIGVVPLTPEQIRAHVLATAVRVEG